MSEKNIDTLRDHLFGALDALKNKDDATAIERSQAICNVAQTIINTAKVEVEYLRIAGNGTSKFLGEPEKLPTGINGVTRHRLQG